MGVEYVRKILGVTSAGFVLGFPACSSSGLRLRVLGGRSFLRKTCWQRTFSFAMKTHVLSFDLGFAPGRIGRCTPTYSSLISAIDLLEHFGRWNTGHYTGSVPITDRRLQYVLFYKQKATSPTSPLMLAFFSIAHNPYLIRLSSPQGLRCCSIATAHTSPRSPPRYSQRSTRACRTLWAAGLPRQSAYAPRTLRTRRQNLRQY